MFFTICRASTACLRRFGGTTPEPAIGRTVQTSQVLKNACVRCRLAADPTPSGIRVTWAYVLAGYPHAGSSTFVPECRDRGLDLAKVATRSVEIGHG